jgi:hypothetical protein
MLFKIAYRLVHALAFLLFVYILIAFFGEAVAHPICCGDTGFKTANLIESNTINERGE